MPVVKLESECPEDLDKAIKTEIIILAEGKKEIVLERKRNSKIVRCFNCNPLIVYFWHIQLFLNSDV
jgi:hypothetical protein